MVVGQMVMVAVPMNTTLWLGFIQILHSTDPVKWVVDQTNSAQLTRVFLLVGSVKKNDHLDPSQMVDHPNIIMLYEIFEDQQCAPRFKTTDPRRPDGSLQPRFGAACDRVDDDAER